MEATEELLTITFQEGFWKARPAEEGGKRWVYFESSNENRDQEKEKILKAALMGSADFFLAHGNIDIDHMTILGHRLGKQNPHAWEIGKPAEVRESPMGPLVKAAIYKGGPKFPEFGGASAGDYWWSTVHDQDPPMQWFPSVGGKPLEKKRICKSGVCSDVVTKCIWRNVGFAKEPQNLSVPAVSTIAFGEFAKAALYAETNGECHGGDHCSCGTRDADDPALKAVVAGPAVTDSAALTGGAALRLQSIQGGVVDPFDDAAARYLKSLHTGMCEHTQPGKRPSVAAMQDHFEKCEGHDSVTARRYALRAANRIALTLDKARNHKAAA